MTYQTMTRADRAEFDAGYEDGMESFEGAVPPSQLDEPYGAGWLEGNRERARLASDRADASEAEIAAALGLPLDMDDPGEPEHPAPGVSHWCRPVQDNVPMPADDRLCRWCGLYGHEIRAAAAPEPKPAAVLIGPASIAHGPQRRASFSARYAAARAEREQRQAASGGELSISAFEGRGY